MTSNLPAAAVRAEELSRPEVLASFFQGLSDPTRVRILELLAERPLTVTELVAALGVAQGRVSSHLSCLRWCGYVEATVDGRFNRYRLIDERVRQIVRLGEEIVRDNGERLSSCLVLATEDL
jgi:ArsR family transcriptional regulator, cadmium/lead-responsive transcriptional repressor